MGQARQFPAKGRWWWLQAFVALASLLVAISAVALLALFLAWPETFHFGSRTATRQRLVGTWTGAHGVTMQLRADGTARSRSAKTHPEIAYFEWSASEDELSIVVAGAKRARSGRSIACSPPAARRTVTKS